MRKTIFDILKTLRADSQLTIKETSDRSGVDQALISKYEKGKRIPSESHLKLLADLYDVQYQDLKKYLLAEKIIQLLEDEPLAEQAMILAEPRLEYMSLKTIEDQIKTSSKVQVLLKELDDLKISLANLSPQSRLHKEKVMESFSLEYTYQSNKIEGNTLTLSETMMVIKEGITISGKSVNEHLEAINHSEAVSIMYDIVKSKIVFKEQVLLQLHNLILRGIDTRNAGKYRSVNVRISGAEHIPPEPYMVPVLMEAYFKFYKETRNTMHPVLLAAEMHERLVTIHPFIDGNGRTSRLVMNLILLSFGYPIAILKGDNQSRMKYFQALEKVQIDGDPEAFYILVIEALKKSLDEHIRLYKSE